MDRRWQIGLVEDNPSDVHALRRGFGRRAELRVWDSGEALLASILTEPTVLERLDLVLLDLGLPGIDGVHLAHTVRSARGGAELPIVVLSGSAAEKDIVRALQADVTEYEVKPSNTQDLRLLVERMFELLARSERTRTASA